MFHQHINYKNFPDELTLYSAYKIEYISCNGGFYEGKWLFNIYHSIPASTKKIYNNFVLLDILVNDVESTAICEVTYSSFLKCVSNHENQQSGDIIKIDTSKAPISGSVIFASNKGIIFISYPEFNMKYDLSYGYSNPNDKLEIIVEGKLEEEMTNDLEEETPTKIKISQEDNDYDVTCLTNNVKKSKGSYVYLVCPTQLPVDKKSTKIKLDENKKSNNVIFESYYDNEIRFIE